RIPGLELTELLSLDRQRRDAITLSESLRAEQNKVGKEIPQRKKAGESADELIARLSQIKKESQEAQDRLKEIEARFEEIALGLPNVPHESVLRSLNKEDNQVVKTFGEKPSFDFPFRNHLEVADHLGILDFERGAKITGAGFPIYVGDGARLERALLNFLLDQNEGRGFVPLGLPYLVNSETGYTSGQLPKFADQMYHVTEDDLYVIPTAEIALGGLHRDEIVLEEKLPLRYTAYTACFRREAGTYGTEERGLVRNHQFNKVELFSLVAPDKSYEELELLRSCAEDSVEKLGLHYQTTNLVSGDLGQAAAKTYDIEVWLPGQNRYYEVSSCSNCEAYQARRGNIRFRRGKEGKPEFLHTLNGSSLATSRLMIG
ncbi:MAG: serine--tRNA ligase, partial [Candidatus Omnitrophica bacterium]|nr:serine--tRNA ligase [Candidatus Omnitrophota bacterium]